MPLSFDFLLQFFAFSAGVGIVLVYAYWHSVRPDVRLRWATLVLVCVVINYLPGLATFLYVDETTLHWTRFVHFAIQGLSFMGMLLGAQQLLRLLGAQLGGITQALVWISAVAMALCSMAANLLRSPIWLVVGTAALVMTGSLLLLQFWRLPPQPPLQQRIRRLAIIGLAVLLPAFVLQSWLPERWLVVHPVDALAYLYIMGCALAIALQGLSNGPVQADNTPLSLGNAQHRFDLTEREFQVLRLLVQAKPYKTIADELSISAHTVKTHASNVYRKTGIARKSDLKFRFRDE